MSKLYHSWVLSQPEAVYETPTPPRGRLRRLWWRLRRQDRPYIIGWRDRKTGEMVPDIFDDGVKVYLVDNTAYLTSQADAKVAE